MPATRPAAIVTNRQQKVLRMRSSSKSLLSQELASELFQGEAPKTLGTRDLVRHFVETMTERRQKAFLGLASLPKSDLDEFPDVEGLERQPAEKGALGKSRSKTLPVSEAIATVLLAACFDRQTGLLDNIRSGDSVILVELPDASFGDVARDVLRHCVLETDTAVLQSRALATLSCGDTSVEGKCAVMLDCDWRTTREKSEFSQTASVGLSLGVPVFVFVVDGGPLLPESIRGSVDAVVRFGGLDPRLLACLIEAVTGSPAPVPDEPWVKAVELPDLLMTVSESRGAESSVDRLRTVVRRRISVEKVEPRFADLHGYGNAKFAAMAMIQDIEDYRNGRIRWSAVDRGMVLEGPSGTGKTIFAKAFAKAANLPFVAASLAQWQASGTGHLGDCLAAMARSFADARSCAPSVLFIDELDSVGDRRTFDNVHKNYSVQIVNGLLEQLDGAIDRTGIIVLGATNNIGDIDQALLRPGRFDQVFRIDLPDPVDLAAILRTCLGDDLPDVHLLKAAMAGQGGTGADAAAWVRRARGSARRADRKMTFADLMAAVRDGRAPLEDALRERIAIHEVGHACAAIAMGLGSVDSLAVHDKGGDARLRHGNSAVTRESAIASMIYVLAGRAAEIVCLGGPSAGAGGVRSSDLAAATRTAVAYERSWGLGSYGPVWQGEPTTLTSQLASGDMLSRPVVDLLMHAEAQAELLVRSNENPIRRCAGRLADTGYLDSAAVLANLADVVPFKTDLIPILGRP